MITVEQLYDDLLLVKDDSYYLNRYSIILNFLDKRNLEVLDYQIKVIQGKNNLFWQGQYNVTPTSLEQSIETVLKELSEDNTDDDLKDVTFELCLLVQKKKNK